MIGSVTSGKDDEHLRFVDTILYDLAFGGGIDGGFSVRRWPGADTPGKVVIQSGRDGPHELPLPDMAVPDAVARFVAELQALVIDVQDGEFRPACPEHSDRHPLECRSVDGDVLWVCPDGHWRCPIGEYDEFNWPPRDLDDETVPGRVFDRLQRRHIEELHSVDGHRPVGRVRVAVWPLTDELIARLQQIAAPVELEVYPEPGQWWLL